MSGADSTFRGYRAISDLLGRMEVFASWFESYRPGHKILTLRRSDLDLLRRWPKAAALFNVTTTDGGTFWRGFELRADHSTPRYEQGRLPHLHDLGGRP